MMSDYASYACTKHLDFLMDDLLEQKQTAPSLEQIPKNQRETTRCNWCNQPAEYRLVFEYEVAGE